MRTDALHHSSTSVAGGSTVLALDCTGDAGAETQCFTKEDRITLDTKPEAAPLATTASCADNQARVQSWRVEDFKRKYDVPEGGNSESTPLSHTGPEFKLRNMANGGLFDCKPGETKGMVVEGTCKGDGEAGFSFDMKLGTLVVKQKYDCGFEATGVAFVQALCEKSGNTYNCALEPFWTGAAAKI
jgi:hypothetical protein